MRVNSSSSGDGTAVAQETPPTINEPAVLAYVNSVLGSGYTSLDGISDQELNRVYVIAQLDVLLQNNPDARVFMCGPKKQRRYLQTM